MRKNLQFLLILKMKNFSWRGIHRGRIEGPGVSVYWIWFDPILVTSRDVLFSRAVCRKFDLIVLSDEIYGLVKFDNQPNLSIAKVLRIKILFQIEQLILKSFKAIIYQEILWVKNRYREIEKASVFQLKDVLMSKIWSKTFEIFIRNLKYV